MDDINTINVLVVNKLDDESLRKISAISPKIRVMTSSPFWEASDTTVGKKLDCMDAEFNKLLSQTEIIFGYRPPINVIERAPNLKWIQTMLAGVDHFLDQDMVKSRITITNAKGIHRIQITEVVFEKMLMFVKMAPMYFQYQQEKKWERHVLARLQGKTLGIIGLGNIGRQIAHVGKAFGMRVVAIRRTTKKISKARNVDILYPRAQLEQLLTESDFVVMVLPSTPETDKMIGAKELRQMKPSAYLINVGRGNTVVEEDLIRALEEKWIAGAGLDAFTVEPLPQSSKLWDFPNVIITPHVAGPIENYFQRATDLFCKNLKLYAEGQKLFNVVDKKHGY